MATLQEILDEQARIKNELQRMEEDDSVTEEDSGDLRDTLVERWELLDTKSKPLIARMEKVRGITRQAADEGNLERPAGETATRYSGGSPDLVIRNKRDPYDNMEAVRSKVITRGELRERALDAIEIEANRGTLAHDFAEEATRKAQEQFFGQANIARHILMTGSEEYQESFRRYLEDPQGEAQRTALSLTSANGGYLLPFVLDPTIILTNSGSANPWRRISNVKQTTSNTWNGVNSAGVTAAWLTEGTITTDTTPTVGNIVVTPAKAAAWVFGSYEVLEDTDFGQQLPRLLADAKDRLEEAAFATGAGSGGVPQGVVNGATTGGHHRHHHRYRAGRHLCGAGRAAAAVPQRSRLRVGRERVHHQQDPAARHRRRRVLLDQPRQGPAGDRPGRPDLRVDHDDVLGRLQLPGSDLRRLRAIPDCRSRGSIHGL